MDTFDAVILAGGRVRPAMAAKTGTDVRALFEWEGKPFVQSTYEALRGSDRIDRIAIVGPVELRKLSGISTADIILPERVTITANLFSAVDALKPRERVLITACDNPLLSTAAFDDFFHRIPPDADVAYPILRHGTFVSSFPGSTNIPVRLRDGAWIGGDCIAISANAVPALRDAIATILDARKSIVKMAKLLGIPFAARLAFRRVTVPQVERQICRIAGIRFRFVPDSNPVFVIDIDDPEDWDYLKQWHSRVAVPKHLNT